MICIYIGHIKPTNDDKLLQRTGAGGYRGAFRFGYSPQGGQQIPIDMWNNLLLSMNPAELYQPASQRGPGRFPESSLSRSVKLLWPKKCRIKRRKKNKWRRSRWRTISSEIPFGFGIAQYAASKVRQELWTAFHVGLELGVKLSGDRFWRPSGIIVLHFLDSFGVLVMSTLQHSDDWPRSLPTF